MTTTTTTTDQNDATNDSRAVASRDDDRRLARETKPSFKTTELIIYVLSVIGVLIASLVATGQSPGWWYAKAPGNAETFAASTHGSWS